MPASQKPVDQSPAETKASVLAAEKSRPTSGASQDSWDPAPKPPASQPPALLPHRLARLQTREPAAGPVRRSSYIVYLPNDF